LITPSLPHLLSHTVETKLIDVHVAMIARVERYDAQKQVVDVQPQLKRRVMSDEHDAETGTDTEGGDDDGETTTETLPIIPNVPVLFPRAGGFFISFPIQRGDYVQLIFNDWPIDAWREGDSADGVAELHENHGLHGAVAIPGVYPAAKALKDAHAQNLVLGYEGGAQAHFFDKHIALGDEKAKEFVALNGPLVKALEDMATAFNGHTHLVSVLAAPSEATSKGPIPSMATPKSVGAAKVKAS
jgi:hypothetical protein